MILATGYNGVTRRALALWDETKDQMDEISEIFLCEYEMDAILHGFYEVEKSKEYPFLEKIVSVPTMVIIDRLGQEFRVDGCNCGYGGEGPQGSIQILKDIGIENIEDTITKNRIISIKKTGDTWDKSDIDTDKSKFNTFMQREFAKEHKYSSIDSPIVYRSNKRLIFTPFEFSDYEDDPIGFLHYYSTRLFDQIDFVTIFADESEAYSKGKVTPPHFSKDKERIYQIVISGKNNREIWLDPYVNKYQPFEEQAVIQRVLKTIGFPELNRPQSVLSKLRKTLGSFEERSIELRIELGELVIEEVK